MLWIPLGTTMPNSARCARIAPVPKARLRRDDDLGSLPNREFPRLVVEQRRLTLGRLHRHEAHRRAPDRLARRASASFVGLRGPTGATVLLTIGLAALHIRFT